MDRIYKIKNLYRFIKSGQLFKSPLYFNCTLSFPFLFIFNYFFKLPYPCVYLVYLSSFVEHDNQAIKVTRVGSNPFIFCCLSPYRSLYVTLLGTCGGPKIIWVLLFSLPFIINTLPFLFSFPKISYKIHSPLSWVFLFQISKPYASPFLSFKLQSSSSFCFTSHHLNTVTYCCSLNIRSPSFFRCIPCSVFFFFFFLQILYF